uniref:Reticulon-like protein n=1 Tax=Aegilops tauschii subsp. strangulata TaxID=200361 RepID=A0A453LYX0_AEGTS
MWKYCVCSSSGNVLMSRNVLFQAIVGLWAASVAGSWFNFLTVIYIGFVCAHTLPVLYEKYEDQVDDFLYSILGLLREQYQKLDSGVLSRIPSKRNKKSE